MAELNRAGLNKVSLVSSPDDAASDGSGERP